MTTGAFFDAVETTVANASLIKATTDRSRIELELTDYALLGAYEKKQQFKKTTVKRILRCPIAYHLFKKFMHEFGCASQIKFLRRCTKYAQSREVLERKLHAHQMFRQFLDETFESPLCQEFAPPQASLPGGSQPQSSNQSVNDTQSKQSQEERLDDQNPPANPSPQPPKTPTTDNDEPKPSLPDTGDNFSEIPARSRSSSKSKPAAPNAPIDSGSNDNKSSTSPEHSRSSFRRPKKRSSGSSSSGSAGHRKSTRRGRTHSNSGSFFRPQKSYDPALRIPAEAIARVRPRLDEAPQDLFDECQQAVQKHVAKEFLPEFLKTDYYEHWVQLRNYSERDVGFEDFHSFRILGKGAFGSVFAVQKKDTRATYAMKEMKKKQVKFHSSQWVVVSEKRALEKVNSPFMLNLKYAVHNNEALYMLLDMCKGGDLKFHLSEDDREKPYFAEHRACFHAAEILISLKHLHQYNFLYRDMKPDNVLLDEHGHVRLSDFGLVMQLPLPEGKKMHLAGTPGYWSPECLKREPQTFTSDFWSWGVVLYEMITGRRPRCPSLETRASRQTTDWTPFHTSDRMEKNAKSGGKCVVDINWDPLISTPAKDLLQKIFTVEPAERLGHNGVDEIMAHPFFDCIDWPRLASKKPFYLDDQLTPPFKPNANDVNAHSLGEVGEMADAEWRKEELTDKDHRWWTKHKFDFRSEQVIYRELVNVLKRNAEFKLNPPPANLPQHGSGGTCCVIL